jgi:NO-binding membrane sensor protein with MHYT domain
MGEHDELNGDVAKELHIKAEQLKLLFAPIFPVTIAHVIAAMMMVHLLWDQTQVSHVELVVAAILISFIAVIRLLLSLAYKKKPPLSFQVDVWEKRFLAGSIAIGLAWAFSELWIFPRLDESHQLVMILIVGGVSALAIVTLSAMRSTYITFIPIVLMPVTVMMFFESHHDASGVTLLLTVMVIGFLGGAERNYKNIEPLAKV